MSGHHVRKFRFKKSGFFHGRWRHTKYLYAQILLFNVLFGYFVFFPFFSFLFKKWILYKWNFFRLEEDSSAARCQFCGKEVNKMFLNLSKTHPSGNNESNETKFTQADSCQLPDFVSSDGVDAEIPVEWIWQVVYTVNLSIARWRADRCSDEIFPLKAFQQPLGQFRASATLVSAGVSKTHTQGTN